MEGHFVHSLKWREASHSQNATRDGEEYAETNVQNANIRPRQPAFILQYNQNQLQDQQITEAGNRL